MRHTSLAQAFIQRTRVQAFPPRFRRSGVQFVQLERLAPGAPQAFIHNAERLPLDCMIRWLRTNVGRCYSFVQLHVQLHVQYPTVVSCTLFSNIGPLSYL